MKNKVELQGELIGFKKFSDKIGSMQLKVTTSSHSGEEYHASFYISVFKDHLGKIMSIPLGSVVSVSGRLKNSKYEKNGETVWKLEVVMNTFSVSEEIGVPTRLAKMSPNDSKYVTRDNSDFRDEVENIPF